MLIICKCLCFFLLNTFQEESAGSFGSLEGLSALFQNPMGVLVGWLHYLAFDLFVGIWMVKDSQGIGIPQLWMILPLLATFMLGPTGLLIYVAIKWAKTRKVEYLF